jgi:hypothetical protein
MHPEQEPLPQHNYDFILNPQQAPKKRLNLPFGGDSFFAKVAFIVGGALLLMIVLAVIINLFFGGQTNVDKLVSVTQSEQEIIRLSAEGGNATSQPVKDAAVTTRLSVTTHQKQWLAFLARHGRELKNEQLNLKEDPTTDNKLKLAQQTSTFDTTYITIMRSQLEAYADELRTAHSGMSNKADRDLLSTQYDEVQLLLKQWPSSTLGLAFF